jgi:hypothetical protein
MTTLRKNVLILLGLAAALVALILFMPHAAGPGALGMSLLGMALTKDRKLTIVASDATRNRVGKVAGDAILFKGAALCRNGDGFLVPGADTVGLQFVGWADEHVDATGFDDGDLEIRYVTAAEVEMENDATHPVEQSDLYKPCYLTADNTVGSNVGNGVICGIAASLTPAGKVMVYGAPELATMAPSSEASLMKMFVITDPAAKDDDVVHAIYDDVDGDFPGPFTNPDKPRNLRVTLAAGWDGGDVEVTGTDQYDDPVSETFLAGSGVVRTGVKIFKTVTAATKSIPAGVTGNGASIGTGDKLGVVGDIAGPTGVLLVGVTPEAVVVDDTYDAFTPTSAPDGAKDFTLITNIVVATN